MTQDELLEIAEEAMDSGICPTNCPEGCVVEPDGTCPHGYDSIMLEAGLI